MMYDQIHFRSSSAKAVAVISNRLLHHNIIFQYFLLSIRSTKGTPQQSLHLFFFYHYYHWRSLITHDRCL